MTDSIIYISENLRIEDNTVHIENYSVSVTATFNGAEATLTEQNAEISTSPATDTAPNGMIRLVGYDGYYYLKSPNNDQLTQLGAKEGNGHRKGDYTITDE